MSCEVISAAQTWIRLTYTKLRYLNLYQSICIGPNNSLHQDLFGVWSNRIVWWCSLSCSNLEIAVRVMHPTGWCVKRKSLCRTAFWLRLQDGDPNQFGDQAECSCSIRLRDLETGLHQHCDMDTSRLVSKARGYMLWHTSFMIFDWSMKYWITTGLAFDLKQSHRSCILQMVSAVADSREFLSLELVFLGSSDCATICLTYRSSDKLISWDVFPTKLSQYRFWRTLSARFDSRSVGSAIQSPVLLQACPATYCSVMPWNFQPLRMPVFHLIPTFMQSHVMTVL